MKSRKCKKCNQIKSLQSYYKNKQCEDGRIHTCKDCTKKARDAHYSKNRETINKNRREKRIEDPVHRDKVRDQSRKSYRNRLTWYRWYEASRRAQERGLEFTIKEEDIIIPDYCPLLEVPLVVGNGDEYEYSPSLDRKDSTKGYTPDNIWVISKKANSMKNSASVEEIELFYKNIIKSLS